MRKFLFILFALVVTTTSVCAQTQTKQVKKTQKTTVKPIKKTPYKAVSLKTQVLSRDSLSKIKALLVVGPAEQLTPMLISDADKIASQLTDYGVQVNKIYPPNDTWSDIVQASNGVQLFIYLGHGSNNGKAGGLCLSEGIIASDTISSYLKIHKNALILMHHVCNAAGSSASDRGEIGVKTAITRIGDYAHPFIKIGAAGYYANNNSNSMIDFIDQFFRKNTIKQIYTKYVGTTWKVNTLEKYSYDARYEISVASSPSAGIHISYVNGKRTYTSQNNHTNYSIAFVSIPYFTVLDFFK